MSNFLLGLDSGSDIREKALKKNFVSESELGGGDLLAECQRKEGRLRPNFMLCQKKVAHSEICASLTGLFSK